MSSAFPPLISVVGASGVGKTTWLEKVIPELTRRGLRVAAIKHHRGKLEFDRPGKDTYRLKEAGAHQVILSTPGKISLVREVVGEASLLELRQLCSGADIVLAEGYKSASYPQIEVWRPECGPPVGRQETRLAVIGNRPPGWEGPVFTFQQVTEAVDFIISQAGIGVKAGLTDGSPTSRELTVLEEEIYQRNILLPGFGREGQKRLKNSAVLVVGAGGLGSPVAYYLVAAGVGCIGLVDGDVVALSNLQRQILHGRKDAGRLKVESAREKLVHINPELRINIYPQMADGLLLEAILPNYDLVVDCTDSFEARYTLNAACIEMRKPWVHGAVLSYSGQIMTIIPGRGPCYRCLHPVAPPPGAPDCRTLGVLGAVPGVVGALQAAEAIKYLVGIGQLLVGRLLIFDLLGMNWAAVEVERNPHCPDCGGLKV